jgi:hypothetical protein
MTVSQPIVLRYLFQHRHAASWHVLELTHCVRRRFRRNSEAHSARYPLGSIRKELVPVIMPSYQRCLRASRCDAGTCLRGGGRKRRLPHPAPSTELPCGVKTEAVRYFSVLSESGRPHEAKCQGIQSDCSAGYLGVTCNELRVQRCSAKGFGRTVQLNPLASRETSSVQRQSVYFSAFSRSFDWRRLRDERHNFHVTFAVSKHSHLDDMSVTEGVNIDKIEIQMHWTARSRIS